MNPVSAATRVAIVDNGGANIASLRFALERLGVESHLTADPRELTAASHVILPGVGAAGDAMRRLETTGLADVIRELPQPLLGICLGMQLLFESSAEDETRCLGLVPGRLEKLSPAPDCPVPHMGWNRIEAVRPCPLLEGIGPEEYFYFVHSYAAPVNESTVAVADYGRPFASVVATGNLFGTQFHPERSARAGQRLLANFLTV
ncbi:MAG TPA: imidazole glycerol phosphate synthase subunit HisH [Steroidobacteraceae bacterium]|nr:imidazole glycerol phosphate synthase subunit HisH [Steroidobacteraceae bacterium]